VTARLPAPLHRPRLGLALLGTALLAVGAVPGAQVPIIADDFQALQQTYAVSGGSLLEAVRFGVDQGRLGGHFNPVGQATGAAYHWSVYAVSARLNSDPQNVDVLAGFVLLWLALAAAVAVLHSALTRGAGKRTVPGYWSLFAASAAVTACTLQIHAPWSNDPVVSYAPAGYGSAALGFGLLALVLRASDPRRGWSWTVAATALAITCVWYYEMLVAAIAASGVVLGLLLLTARGQGARAERLRCSALLGAVVVLPAVQFLLSRRLVSEQTAAAAYEGTSVSVGAQALQTWVTGMLGTLPTAAWPFVLGETGGLHVTGAAIGLAALLFVGTALLLRLMRHQASEGPSTRRPAVMAVVGLLVFSGLSTATHSVTVKYIAEIREVGNVYLFYAVGALVTAVLLGWWLLRATQSRRGRAVLLGLAPVFGLLVLGQAAVNLAVAREVQVESTPWNGPLAAVSVEPGSDPAVRCDVLAAWRAEPWPGYYLNSVSDSVRANFERSFGKPFCPPELAAARGIPPPESTGPDGR